MSAPFKVLLFSICVSFGLIVLVLFKFGLIQFKQMAPEASLPAPVAEINVPQEL